MEPDVQLTEPDSYSKNPDAWQWRSLYEVKEWCYDQGYDSGIEPLWKMMPSSRKQELGEIFLKEGEDHAREWLNEEITETVDTIGNEYLETYVDGQMRLFAGYDVAENGDTLEEGEYGTWEELRMEWERGFRDKLRGNERDG